MKDILMRIVARLFLLSALALSSLTHLKLSYQLRSPLPFPIEKPGTLDTNLNKSVLTRYHFSYLSHRSHLSHLSHRSHLRYLNFFSSLFFTPSTTSTQNTSVINQFTSFSAVYKKIKKHIFSLVNINRRYLRKPPN